jgi:hypothetical protein
VGYLELEADIAKVLRAPSVHGALASLLGSDFTMACAWAEDLSGGGGMMGNHHTHLVDHDQAYHKDGIHTPASVVRDIKVRKTRSWPRSWANFSFYSSIPPGMHELTCIFWANLTPFSLKPRGLMLMYYPNGASLEQGPAQRGRWSHEASPSLV